MCGLAGYFGLNGRRSANEARHLVAEMLDQIRYRGPDEDGIHVDDRLALGHLRLTIVAPDGGAQPRVDAASGDVLGFNGEIYDYARHADELRRDGVHLRDASDTEVLFQMIRRHGVRGALDRLDGMFAFVFYEGAEGTFHLARDRFGEKPLFYGTAGRTLAFASELKSLRRHPDFAARPIDPVAVNSYLTFEYMAGEDTVFAGIRKVLPGHLVTVTPGDDGLVVASEAYWRPAYRPIEEVDEAAAIDRMETLIDDSVRARLVADVPVGVFLSGGVDSGLIAAVAARHAPGITAFTVKMTDASYDETAFARAVAQTYGLRHEVAELDDRALLAALDDVEARLDEPFADPSIIPTYLLSAFARRHVTVALGGDGGDELFAGYPTFRACRYQRLVQHCPGGVARAIRRLLDLLPHSGRYMAPDYVMRQVAQGLGEPLDRQCFAWLAPYTEARKRALTTPAFHAAVGGADSLAPMADWLTRQDGLGDDPVERMSYLFTKLYLPDDILTKVDRASMYNSLEVRAPYLARDVAEYAMRLPSRLKVRGRTTKYLLKALAARHLPKSLVYRGKHGFAVPMADFLRGPLRQRVAETLLDAGNPVADWFRPAAIEDMLDEHQARRRDHRKRIWSLYVLFRFARAAHA